MKRKRLSLFGFGVGLLAHAYMVSFGYDWVTAQDGYTGYIIGVVLLALTSISLMYLLFGGYEQGETEDGETKVN